MQHACSLGCIRHWRQALHVVSTGWWSGLPYDKISGCRAMARRPKTVANAPPSEWPVMSRRASVKSCSVLYLHARCSTACCWCADTPVGTLQDQAFLRCQAAAALTLSSPGLQSSVREKRFVLGCGAASVAVQKYSQCDRTAAENGLARSCSDALIALQLVEILCKRATTKTA